MAELNRQLFALMNLNPIPTNMVAYTGTIPAPATWRTVERTGDDLVVDQLLLSSGGTVRYQQCCFMLALLLESPLREYHDTLGSYTYTTSQLLGQLGTQPAPSVYKAFSAELPDLSRSFFTQEGAWSWYRNGVTHKDRILALAVTLMEKAL